MIIKIIKQLLQGKITNIFQENLPLKVNLVEMEKVIKLKMSNS